MRLIQAVHLNSIQYDTFFESDVALYYCFNTDNPESKQGVVVISLRLDLHSVDLPKDIAACAELAAVRHLVWDRCILSSNPEKERNLGHPFHGQNSMVQFGTALATDTLNVMWARALDRATRSAVIPPKPYREVGRYAAKLLSHFEGCQYSTMRPEEAQTLSIQAGNLDNLHVLNTRPCHTERIQLGRASTETHPVLKNTNLGTLRVTTRALNEYRLSAYREKEKMIQKGLWNADLRAAPEPSLKRLAKYLGKIDLSEVSDQHNFRYWLDTLLNQIPDALTIKVYAQSMNRQRAMPYFFVATVPNTTDHALDKLVDVVVNIKYLYSTDIERQSKAERTRQNQLAFERGLLSEHYLTGVNSND